MRKAAGQNPAPPSRSIRAVAQPLIHSVAPAADTAGESRAFDYDDVTLVPRVASTLAHRAEAEPHVAVGPARLLVPLIGSPMPDVFGVEMCVALAGQGALGIVHRFQPIEEEVRELRAVTAAGG